MKPDNRAFELNELKGQTGLSNKKWDKAIKGLTKNKVARVEKTDAGLFVTWLSLQSQLFRIEMNHLIPSKCVSYYEN
jgi:hypothetical protein